MPSIEEEVLEVIKKKILTMKWESLTSEYQEKVQNAVLDILDVIYEW